MFSRIAAGATVLLAVLLAWATPANAELTVSGASLTGGSVFERGMAVVREPMSGDVWVAAATVSQDFPEVGHGFGSDRGGSALIRYGADGFVRSAAFLPEEIEVVKDMDLAPDGSVVLTGLGEVDRSNSLSLDPFVAKVAADGSGFEWLRSLSDRMDWVAATAIGPDGSIYAAGTRPNPSPAVYGGSTVLKLGPQGNSILYQAPLGAGSQSHPEDIAVDADGGAVILVQAFKDELPVIDGFHGYHGGTFDAYIARISPNGSRQTYGTYVGGGAVDRPSALAIGPDGGIYITGSTESANFDFVRPIDRQLRGTGPPSGGQDRDAFVSKIAPGGQGFEYSTLLGGIGTEEGNDIEVMESGSAVIVGTVSGTGPPVVGSNLSTDPGTGRIDAFITRMTPSGTSLSASTPFGGLAQDSGDAVALSGSGDMWLTGTSGSADLPGLRTPGPNGAPDVMVAQFEYTPEVVDPVVRAKRVQRQGRPTVQVTARAGAAEAVEVRAKGMLKAKGSNGTFKPVSKRSRFGKLGRVVLRLNRKQSDEMLDRGSARVTLRFTLEDEDGDIARRRVHVKLTRSPR
jgi:hypothetical protein